MSQSVMSVFLIFLVCINNFKKLKLKRILKVKDYTIRMKITMEFFIFLILSKKEKSLGYN